MKRAKARKPSADEVNFKVEIEGRSAHGRVSVSVEQLAEPVPQEAIDEYVRWVIARHRAAGMATAPAESVG